jgi:hypothetical protein
MSFDVSQTSPRWIVVVQATQAELCAWLQERLGDQALVLIERRDQDRRRETQRVGNERRLASRRQQRFVARVYEAAAVEGLQPEKEGGRALAALEALARCAACGRLLTYELPRFPQAPARIDVEAVHLSPITHAVDIRAVTRSGRLLVNQRVRARPAS